MKKRLRRRLSLILNTDQKFWILGHEMAFQAISDHILGGDPKFVSQIFQLLGAKKIDFSAKNFFFRSEIFLSENFFWSPHLDPIGPK